MNDQILSLIESVNSEAAKLNTEVIHGEFSSTELKSKQEKIFDLLRYAFGDGYSNLIPNNIQQATLDQLKSMQDNYTQVTAGNPQYLPNVASSIDALVQYLPQILAGVQDLTAFETRMVELRGFIEDAKAEGAAIERLRKSTEKNTKDILGNATDLLGKISTGVLAENIKKQINSWWNWILFSVYIALAVASGVWLVWFAYDVKDELIATGSLNYKNLLLVWLAKLPVVVLFGASLVLLRGRVKFNDELRYRQSVALSLESEVTVIFNKAEQIEDKKAKERVRTLAIELLAGVINEFSKSPTASSKQSVDLGISKVGNIKASDEH